MPANLAAARVDNCARANRQARRQVARGLAARDEADLLALRLVRDGQPELARVLADLGLGDSAERKDDARQTLSVEVIEHVRLVLGGIDRRVQLTAVEDPGVVAGREAVEAELEDARQHEVEAHEGVAPHARIGRAAREIRLVERLDHALAELLLQVPAVIRNVEQRCDAARVLDGVQRAAAAVARRLLGVVARPLLERHADDVVALRLQQRGRDGRVDAARHRDGDPHFRFSLMCVATTSASSPTP